MSLSKFSKFVLSTSILILVGFILSMESRECYYKKKSGKLERCTKQCCGYKIYCMDKCDGVACGHKEDCGDDCCKDGKCQSCDSSHSSSLSKSLVVVIAVLTILFLAILTIVICCCRCKRSERSVVSGLSDDERVLLPAAEYGI